MEQSRESKLIKNTAILSIGVFFPKLAVFITLPILTGCLSKEEYGIYDLVLTLVSLLLPAATLQIQTAAFRFLIESRDDLENIKKIISNIYAFIIPTSTMVLVGLYFVLHKQAFFIRWIICVYFLFETLLSTTRQISRGIGKNSIYATSTFVGATTQIVCVAVFVWGLDEGLAGAILALGCGEVIAFAYLTCKIKLWKYIDFTMLDKKQLKRLLSYSWPMVPNSLSMWVMRVSDRFIITAMMGAVANAAYAVAYKIPSILNLAENTFNMAWQESASLASKDTDANAFYTTTFSNLYNFALGLLSLLIGSTPLLFNILVRGDYGEAYNQILILYMAVFFFVLSSFWGALYVAFERTKSVGLTSTVAAVINLGVDIALIKFIGLYAASGSTLVSYVFLCVYRIIDTRKFLSIKYNFKFIFTTIIIVMIQCIICAQRIIILDILNLLVGTIVFWTLNRKNLIMYVKKLWQK